MEKVISNDLCVGFDFSIFFGGLLCIPSIFPFYSQMVHEDEWTDTQISVVQQVHEEVLEYVLTVLEEDCNGDWGG